MRIRIANDIRERIGRLAQVELAADLSDLNNADIQVLTKLSEAAKYIDAIFLRQVHSENPMFLKELQSSNDADAEVALHYFALNMGPWDQLSDFEPFVGEKKPPRGAGFYPEDITKEEFEAWVNTHPADAEK